MEDVADMVINLFPFIVVVIVINLNNFKGFLEKNFNRTKRQRRALLRCVHIWIVVHVSIISWMFSHSTDYVALHNWSLRERVAWPHNRQNSIHKKNGRRVCDLRTLTNSPLNQKLKPNQVNSLIRIPFL